MVKMDCGSWEAKAPSVAAALTHCQTGRTRQEEMRAGVGEETIIVYSAGLTGSGAHLRPTLRLGMATGSRRETEREKLRERSRKRDRQRDS